MTSYDPITILDTVAALNTTAKIALLRRLFLAQTPVVRRVLLAEMLHIAKPRERGEVAMRTSSLEKR